MSTGAQDREWFLQRRLHFTEILRDVEEHAVFLMSDTGEILTWNVGAQRLKGYSGGEIVGRSCELLYSPEEVAAGVPRDELARAATDGSVTSEGWRLRKDGTRFWANTTLTGIKGPGGNTVGFVKITRDLTERRENLEKLRQSEERLRLLIESVTDYAIFLLDPSGTIITWNPGAKRIKGYDADEIIGRHFSVFYPQEARDSELPLRLLAEAHANSSSQDEGWRVKKSGERIWASVVITAMRDEHGTHIGYVKITRDLTERRESQLRAVASERKDTFLATLAHELRNPLAPLGPGLEIILRAPHDTGRVVQVASMIRRQVDQMSRLIEDLVDLSRVTSGRITLRRERVQVADIVEGALETVNPLFEKRGHRLTLTLPSCPAEIDGDRGRLIQALTNLLVNAAKFTPDHGEIALQASVTEDSQVEIRVRDNGIGIEPDRLDEVFELFQQVGDHNSDGLGIGLTLVKTLVAMHNGTITAASEGHGRGSEFTVHLPAHPDTVAPSGVKQTASPETGRGFCRVLIADDSKASADTLALFFEAEGMEPTVVYDGQQAVDAAERIKPDIICLDIGMPVMDGNEAAIRIRLLIPDALLIAVTGWGSPQDRELTRLSGFDHHLVKPLRIDDLRDVIKERANRCFAAGNRAGGN